MVIGRRSRQFGVGTELTRRLESILRLQYLRPSLAETRAANIFISYPVPLALGD